MRYLIRVIGFLVLFTNHSLVSLSNETTISEKSNSNETEKDYFLNSLWITGSIGSGSQSINYVGLNQYRLNESLLYGGRLSLQISNRVFVTGEYSKNITQITSPLNPTIILNYDEDDILDMKQDVFGIGIKFLLFDYDNIYLYDSTTYDKIPEDDIPLIRPFVEIGISNTTSFLDRQTNQNIFVTFSPDKYNPIDYVNLNLSVGTIVRIYEYLNIFFNVRFQSNLFDDSVINSWRFNTVSNIYPFGSSLNDWSVRKYQYLFSTGITVII
jgi:hypothetical protein